MSKAKNIGRRARKQSPVRLLTAVAVGVGGYYGGRKLSQEVEFFRKEWYVLPGAMVALGGAAQHFAGSPTTTKGAAMQSAGVAMVGSGAALGAYNYELNSSRQGAEAAGLVGRPRRDVGGLVRGNYRPLPAPQGYDAFADRPAARPAPKPASDTGYMNPAMAF